MGSAGPQPGQGNTSKYKLHLTVPTNNAAADGTAKDVAKATLTLDGAAQPGQPITFDIQSGSATFGNGKQQIQQTTDGDGCAEIDFTDTTADAMGEIVAWMTNNTAVKSNTASYSFTESTQYTLKLSVPINYQFKNQGQAVVFLNNNPAPSGIHVKFVLTPLLEKDAHFLTSDTNIVEKGDGYIVVQAQQYEGQCIANAWMVIDQPVTHNVQDTLTASLPDYPSTQPQSQQVMFLFGGPPSSASPGTHPKS